MFETYFEHTTLKISQDFQKILKSKKAVKKL